MWSAFIDLLGGDRYSAHAICLSNDRIVMTLFAAANLLTAVSYFCMGMCLMIYASRIIRISKQAKFLFGAFIVSCSLHHACQVLTLFAGVYRLELIVDMLMAGISAGTAVYTLKELPKSFDLHGAAG